MLLKGSAEMKAYLPSIVLKGNLDVYDDAISQQDQAVKSAFLGQDLYDRLSKSDPDDGALYNLARRVIALRSFISVMADADLVLTEGGFAVINNDAYAPASKQRIDNLKASLAVRLSDAEDLLTESLVAANSVDSVWRNTVQFEVASRSLIYSLGCLQSYYVRSDIADARLPRDWDSYILLRPKLWTSLVYSVGAKIGMDYIDALVAAFRNRTELGATEKFASGLVRCATVSYALDDTATGDAIMGKLIAYINANSAKFPLVTSWIAGRGNVVTHDDSPIFLM